MKKLFFQLLVLLLVAALASCDLNSVPAGENNTSQGGDDGGARRELPRTVTLRLADAGEYENDTIGIGLGNTVAERTLTLDNARASHDFFEAVFYYSTNPGNTVIARTQWDIGITPELRGVHRTEGVGVNYGNIAGSPSAVLFVGTKDDKTLLAVGRLAEVDGVATTYINTNTKSVTFEVTALKAGVSFEPSESSFRTYSDQNSAEEWAGNNNTTLIKNDIYLHYIGQKKFPFFQLSSTSGNVNFGAYNFAVDAGATTFAQYAAGIVLAGERDWEARNPRYIVTEGEYQYSSLLVQDLGMRRTGQLVIVNNDERLNFGSPQYNPQTGPAYFKNPVVFKIDTSASLPQPHTGTVFALVFEIFVYNLTAIQSSPIQLSGGGTMPPPFLDPVRWRISTGTEENWLNLDDGLGGESGAVFLGTGDVEGYLDQSNNTPAF